MRQSSKGVQVSTLSEDECPEGSEQADLAPIPFQFMDWKDPFEEVDEALAWIGLRQSSRG